jgi:hypothetical protein
LQESDPLDKVLEYVPSDYITLTNLLQEHIQNKMTGKVKDEEHSSLEEYKESEQKDIFVIIKEYYTSTKIIDAFSKSIDKLITLVDDPISLITIDSALYSKLLKATEYLALKHKALEGYLTKELQGKSLKGLHNLIKIG